MFIRIKLLLTMGSKNIKNQSGRNVCCLTIAASIGACVHASQVIRCAHFSPAGKSTNIIVEARRIEFAKIKIHQIKHMILFLSFHLHLSSNIETRHPALITIDRGCLAMATMT